MLYLHPYQLPGYDQFIMNSYYLLDEVTLFLNLPYNDKYAIRQMAAVLDRVLILRGFAYTQNIYLFLNRLGA